MATDLDPKNVYRGTVLKRLMELHGVTAHKLAAHLGVTASAVSHWEAGRSGCRTSYELAMAYYFGVPRAEFYTADADFEYISSSRRGVLETFADLRQEFIKLDIKTRVKADKEEDWMVDAGLNVPYMRSRDMFDEFPLGNGGFQLAHKIKEATGPKVVPYTPGDRQAIAERGPDPIISRPAPIKPLLTDYERLDALLAEAEILRQRLNITWRAGLGTGILTAQVEFGMHIIKARKDDA